MHPHPDSSKFPPFTPQCGQQVGASLSHDRGNGASVRGEFQLPVRFARNAYAKGEGSRQMPANDSRQRLLAIAARRPSGERRIGAEDELQQLW